MGFLVYYAYYGIKANSCRPDAILRNLPYLGIATVGIGSGVFHASLKNYTQWGMFHSQFSRTLRPPQHIASDSL